MERTYFDICFDVILSRGEGKFSCLNPAQRAAAVASLALVLAKEGKLENARDHKPDYLRLSQAERERKERENAGKK